VNQTRPHCVNQMGKTHSKPLAARHGRGTAWARHAMCESALNLQEVWTSLPLNTMLRRKFGIRLPSEVAYNDIVDRVCEDERWMALPQIVYSGGDELSGCCSRENLLTSTSFLNRSCQNFVLNLWTTFVVNQRSPSACNPSFILSNLH
jgi:hypothetical protein